MNYLVDWSDDAIDALAAIYVAAPNKQAVTDAQAQIDHALATNPLGHGTIVSEGLYAVHVPPLRVLFEVAAAQRCVLVVSVSLQV
jgi:hypothetical protein